MIQCEHKDCGLCMISTRLANMPVPAKEDACGACLKHDKPKQINTVTASKAIYQLSKSDIQASPNLINIIQTKRVLVKDGPGTELEKLISWFKSTSSTCNCKNRIARMNKWGPDQCEQNIELIKKWLKQSASDAGIPYIDFVVTILIKRAISNARRKMGSNDNNSPA